jgi:hypothetical protein
MTGAMVTVLRLLALAVFGLVAIGAVLPVVVGEVRGDDGRLTTSDGDTVNITGEARAAGLTFDPSVAAGDREWILQAIGRARPEAARLIAEVDGLVVVRTFTAGGTTIGVTRGHDRGFTVELNVGYLDGKRALDRPTVVLHELGHVVDFALVPKALDAQLDGQIPRGGPCGAAIDCELMEERFADTFAKWALNGAVSEVGAGYGIPMPASIEDWGAPLAQLSVKLRA